MCSSDLNTVESDLNASASAESMGLTPLLTAVGDKWILLKIHLAILQQKLLMAKHSPKKQKELKNKIALLQKKGVTRVGDLLSLEASIPPSQTAAKIGRAHV